MRHKWVISPRGKLSKYYTCKVCGKQMTAFSRKDAAAYGGICKEAATDTGPGVDLYISMSSSDVIALDICFLMLILYHILNLIFNN